ncbi:hypothetical protein V7056_17980 [Bacillus sp. JJ664]
MKRKYLFVLAGIICISLCCISLNPFINEDGQKLGNLENGKLVNQIKLASKHKIVTVPMPNNDSSKFIVNKMPTKFGQVVIQNLTVR